MGQGLGAADVDRYWQDGYLAPLNVLTAEEARHYRNCLEAAEAQAGDKFASEFKHKPHLVWHWADELIRHPTILDAVEAIIGPNILCWESALFTKPAQSEDYISWHQDITYWGLEAAGNVVTAWLALSPSNVASGCMRVVPGTHKMNVVEHKDTFSSRNMLSRGQEIAVEVEEDQAVDLILDPGQFSLHHVKIFHGSNANGSTDRRIGYAMRFVPPDIRQEVGKDDSARLVRGEDRFGHFELEDAPQQDFSDAAIANHARLKAQRMSVLLREI